MGIFIKYTCAFISYSCSFVIKEEIETPEKNRLGKRHVMHNIEKEGLQDDYGPARPPSSSKNFSSRYATSFIRRFYKNERSFRKGKSASFKGSGKEAEIAFGKRQSAILVLVIRSNIINAIRGDAHRSRDTERSSSIMAASKMGRGFWRLSTLRDSKGVNDFVLVFSTGMYYYSIAKHSLCTIIIKLCLFYH